MRNKVILLWAFFQIPWLGTGEWVFDIGIEMLKHLVVPDVIPVPPHEMCLVYYPKNNITPDVYIFNKDLTQDPPIVQWDADPKSYYTLILTNPDVPNRTYAVLKEYHLWLVGNIPGNKIEWGEVLTEYKNTDWAQDRSFRRNIFLIYKQQGKISFKHWIKRTVKVGLRSGFNTYDFARQYKLGDPLFGNFYFHRW
ncbi:protein D2-like [Planococcus citri]|uniref:protein D2-like n=1 Tax=Planococcus citri TaxID=170843 RepID=UPI0031F9D2EE